MTKESMTSALCLVNRHEQCRNLVVTLAYTGPCRCPHHDQPRPVVVRLPAFVGLPMGGAA